MKHKTVPNTKREWEDPYSRLNSYLSKGYEIYGYSEYGKDGVPLKIELREMTMSQAKQFKEELWELINNSICDAEVRGGIIILTFPDGSILDFTDPAAKTEPPRICELHG